MIKRIVLMTVAVCISLSAFSQVEKIVGRWKTIDDDGKTAKSIVYIYKASNGRYFGKIEKLFEDSDKLCSECEGDLKDKPELGLTIIYNMVEKGGMLTAGTILDPANGKFYFCNLSYNPHTGKLNVRGSLDKRGWLGRSQTWIRVG